MGKIEAAAKPGRLLRTLYAWAACFVDPIRFASAFRNMAWFLGDWYRYSRLAGAEPVRWVDTCPQLHDRTIKTPLDHHYFWMSNWAMRRILAEGPPSHFDASSYHVFVNLLSAVLPVFSLEYRPLAVSVCGQLSMCGDLLHLPLASGSMRSVSCLHVAEHIGLGRYGDSLNPHGTRQACLELARVVAPGGNLYFAVPVGRARVCFNSCRIHEPGTIVQYFQGLELLEFSAVDDDGRYLEHADPGQFGDARYGCGMFWFRRPSRGPNPQYRNVKSGS